MKNIFSPIEVVVLCIIFLILGLLIIIPRTPHFSKMDLKYPSGTIVVSKLGSEFIVVDTLGDSIQAKNSLGQTVWIKEVELKNKDYK